MPAQSKAKLPATLIPGDGIGPEIVKSAVDILDALGSPFEWDIRQGGLAAIDESHDPLPQATLDSIRRTRLALKGPLTTPVGGGFRSINVRLREEFGLYANVRPVRSMVPGGRFDDIDIVRQLLRAFEYWRLKRLAVDLVILNERPTSYLQDLQETIDHLARPIQSRPKSANDVRGSVFVLRNDLVPAEIVALLQTVARVVLFVSVVCALVDLVRSAEAFRSKVAEHGAPQRSQRTRLDPLARVQ